MMKLSKDPKRPRLSPAIGVLVASIACLGLGFYAGTTFESDHLRTVPQPQASQAISQQQAPQIDAAALIAAAASAAAKAAVKEVIDSGVLQRQAQQQPLPQAVTASNSASTVATINQASKHGSSAICLNTCPKARDGVCNDGRQGPREQDSSSHRVVLCDLGTDCEDCGPWTPSGPTPSWAADGSGGPIELLRSRNVEVRVRSTGTVPPFMFAYTDPKRDLGVSKDMDAPPYGVEMGITKIFYKIFKDGCKNGQGLFADVGANFGWYSVLAAAMGCRVIAFEPIPHFHAFFEYSVYINGFAGRVDRRRNVVSHEDGKIMTMVAPRDGTWGTAGVDGLNIDSSIKSDYDRFNVSCVSLSSALKEKVLLMKVDVEGWEWAALKGAHDTLKQGNIENIIMEYSPGVPERTRNEEHMKATVQMLMDIVDYGYRIAHVTATGGGPEKDFFDTPLLPMEEVLKANLQYDMRDTINFMKQEMACYPAPLHKFWGSNCQNFVPEDLNPRSFRSMFGHNTNIWASRNKALQPLQNTVGILKLTDPPETFFVKDELAAFGMGSRGCLSLDPQYQVRHRCRCKNEAVCGDMEKVVEKLAKQGQVPTNFIFKTS